MLRSFVRDFCQDECGAAGVEWAFVASVLVLGSVVGLLALRSQIFGVAPLAPELHSTDSSTR